MLILNSNGDFLLPAPVNRAKEVDKLYMELLEQNDLPVVVYVTGDSGVGKTTIVEEVYEKLQINNHFGVLPWYRIPPDMSVDGIRQLIDNDLKEAQALKQEKAKASKELEIKANEELEAKASEKSQGKATQKSKDKSDEKSQGKATEKSKDKSDEKPKDEDIRQKLEKMLGLETYLLVIDAEISNSTWNHILDSLPETQNSKVLRITQGSEQILPAKYKQSCIEVQVQPLDEKATTELFCHRVCKAEKNEKYKADVRRLVRRKYRKLIFHITEGLPLAIVLLAGLVRTKDPVEWNAVFEHLKSKQLKRLDNILSLCFDDLPYDLKSCFLYFAALPANMSTGARKMIHMWMAEGFLRPEDGMTMEKVGNRYMQELIDRYLVSLSSVDDDATPGDEEVVIHSKVSAFLQREAQEASFMDIHSSDDAPNLVSSRRLSLRINSGRYTSLVNPMPKLRSIFCSFEDDDRGTESECTQQCRTPFPCCQQPRPPLKEEKNKKHIKQLLRKSKFLRVIHLEGLDIGDKLPVEIGNVMHLQYLGITSWYLETIPASIGQLRNLQTLDVRSTLVRKLPKEFWMMSTLRHVLGDFLVLPKKVGNLEHLQTLDTIKPDKESGWDKCTFANMIRLQTLQIWKLPSGLQSDQKVSAEEPPAVLQSHQHDEIASVEESPAVHQHDEIASVEESPAVPQSKQNDKSSGEKSTTARDKNEKVLSSVLRKLDQLRKLTLYCDFTIPLKVLSRDSSPLLPNLEVVELYGKLNLPKDMGGKLCLPNLRHLLLEGTEVPRKLFNKLAIDLSFLENLYLDSGAYEGLRLVFPPEGFQSLKMLSLNLKRNVEIGKLALTRLEDMQISYYPNVEVEIHGKDNIVNKIKRGNKKLDKMIKHFPDSAGQSKQQGH